MSMRLVIRKESWEIHPQSKAKLGEGLLGRRQETLLNFCSCLLVSSKFYFVTDQSLSIFSESGPAPVEL